MVLELGFLEIMGLWRWDVKVLFNLVCMIGTLSNNLSFWMKWW